MGRNSTLAVSAHSLMLLQLECKGSNKSTARGRNSNWSTMVDNLIARHINISPILHYIYIYQFLVFQQFSRHTKHMNLHKASQLFTMTTKILPKNSGSSPSFAAVSSAPRDPNRVTVVKAYHGTPSGCSRFLRYASPMCGFILGPSPVLKVDHFGESSVKPIFILQQWSVVVCLCEQDSFPPCLFALSSF